MLNIYGFTQVQDEMGWTIINETGTEIFKKRFKGIYIVNEELVVLEEFNGFIKLYFPQHKCVTQEDSQILSLTRTLFEPSMGRMKVSISMMEPAF